MTEQQISNLKAILEKSKPELSSAELDHKILHAAQQHAAETQMKSNAQWFSITSINSMGAIGLSVTLTIFALLAMSQIISVDQLETPTISAQNESLQIIVEPSGSLAPDHKTFDEPIKRPLTQFNETRSKDEILAELNLPSVESMLDNMDFIVATDRSQAAGSLATALSDINLMLRNGELQDARDRYDRLRRSCTVCQLPANLEALALAEYSLPGRI